jgi:general secretion pathway protein C
LSIDPWHGSRFNRPGLVPLDTLLKKYFPLVVLAMLAVVAYFQASGTTELFGAALLGDGEIMAPAASAAAGPRPTNAGRASARSAKPILDRNPFDSITGPLTAEPIDTGKLVTEKSGPVDSSDPLNAPQCTSVRVKLVTESADPTWSLAALQGPEDAKALLRRVGDSVGKTQVVYIGFNPQERSPAVWLAEGASLCQALLFREQPQLEAGGKQPAGKQTKPAGARRGRRGPPPLPKDIASKIKKVSETEFHVDRAVLDKILQNQAELMRSARIVPEQQDGKTVGIRLFGIRPNTLLGTLGLQNGDRLESINGFPMASPEKALEAYARLRTADSLSVQVNRRGKPMTIDFRIK